MVFSPKQALKDNIAALKALFAWEKSGEDLEPEQFKVLRNWRGFGGLKQVLWGTGDINSWKAAGASESDLDMHSLFMELYDLLGDNMTYTEMKKVIASLKESTLTSFYTPSVVPNTFFQILANREIQVNTMLEPSAGAGVFCLSADNFLPELHTVVAYEKDWLTNRILKALLLGDTNNSVFGVCNSPYEESDDTKYDLIATNPPYGDISVYDPLIALEHKSRIHNYFFAKSIEKLNPDGLLAFLVTSVFLDTKGNRATREYLFKNCDFISLCVMPDNLMYESSSTFAPSHFLVVRKREGKTELSDEEQLLVESKYVKGETGMYSLNSYIHEHPEIILGKVTDGKNQYGKAYREVFWEGDITNIESQFEQRLLEDFCKRYKTDVADMGDLEMMGETILDTDADFEYTLKAKYDESDTISTIGINIDGDIVELPALFETDKVEVPNADEMSPKEKEIFAAYVLVRDTFLELNKLENQTNDTK